MSVLDHLPIIEAICKHLDFKTLRSMLFVCFKQSECVKSIVKEFLEERIWIERVKRKPTALKYLEKQTEKICLKAVKHQSPKFRFDKCPLIFIKNQTERICIESVRVCPSSIQCVERQTETICLEAYKKDEQSSRFFDREFQYIPHPHRFNKKIKR